MATFYFNAAVDADWQTLGNWWMSYNAGTDTHSVPATGLPTSTDSIEVRGNITTNSGSEPTVVNASFFGVAYNEIGITVTGNCTFNGDSYNQGTITGNCTFNDSSRNVGTINGNCTFYDDSYHDGGGAGALAPIVINGNATLTNSAYARDPVNDITESGTAVTGTITFSSPTPVTFTLGPNSYGWFSDTTEWVFTAPGPSWFFDGKYLSTYGVITGIATFDNQSFNYGVVNGTATFLNASTNDSSNGPGTVNGIATFDNAYSDGVVNGVATLDGTSRHGSWLSPDAVLTGTVTFNDYSYTEGRIVGTVTFNDFSYNSAGSGTNVVDGDATFNDDSQNGSIYGGPGRVTGDAVFNDTATCGGDPNLDSGYFGSAGIVEGTARFTLPVAAHQMSAPRRAEFGSLEFIYDKGINGSSILGVV